MNIIPHPNRVIGELLERGGLSSTIWTPGDEHKQAELMRVHYVGARVNDLFGDITPGDIVLLNPERYGSTLRVEDDDTGEVTELHTTDADNLLARLRELV